MARRLTLSTLALCIVAVVFAQTLPAGVKKVASMGGITEYDYPNGLGLEFSTRPLILPTFLLKRAIRLRVVRVQEEFLR